VLTASPSASLTWYLNSKQRPATFTRRSLASPSSFPNGLALTGSLLSLLVCTRWWRCAWRCSILPERSDLSLRRVLCHGSDVVPPVRGADVDGMPGGPRPALWRPGCPDVNPAPLPTPCLPAPTCALHCPLDPCRRRGPGYAGRSQLPFFRNCVRERRLSRGEVRAVRWCPVHHLHCGVLWCRCFPWCGG
jgi:hypothetical protein